MQNHFPNSTAEVFLSFNVTPVCIVCADENDGGPWEGEQAGDYPDEKSDLCQATVRRPGLNF